MLSEPNETGHGSAFYSGLIADLYITINIHTNGMGLAEWPHNSAWNGVLKEAWLTLVFIGTHASNQPLDGRQIYTVATVAGDA